MLVVVIRRLFVLTMWRLCVETYKPQLSVEDIEEILGIEKFDEEIAEKTRYVLALFHMR